MIESLVFILPSIFNVFVLFGVAWYIWAIVGMNILGELPQCDTCPINRQANFATFGHAMLNVYVMMTGDGWAFQATYAGQINKAYYLYYLGLIVRADSSFITVF